MGNHFFFSWRYFFHAEDNACRGNTCFRILAAAHTTGGRAKNIVAENTRVVQRMLPLMAISIKSWPWDIEATCVSTKPSLSWSDLRIWRLVGSCHDICNRRKAAPAGSGTHEETQRGRNSTEAKWLYALGLLLIITQKGVDMWKCWWFGKSTTCSKFK